MESKNAKTKTNPFAKSKKVRGPRKIKKAKVKPQRAVARANRNISTIQKAPAKVSATLNNLAAQTQWEANSLRPGEINVPYVDGNGIASKVMTSVLHGTAKFDVAGFDTSAYTLITYCPISTVTDGVAANASGLGVLTGVTGAYAPTMVNLRGLTFNTVFGSTTWASDITGFSGLLDIELLAPDATRSGVCYFGSVQVQTFVNTTVDNLKIASTSTQSLKSMSKFQLRQCINDRSLIHQNNTSVTALTTPGPIGDEWVSYMLIDSLAFVSLNTNAPLDYQININVHENCAWWPAGTSPGLMSIVQKPPIAVEVESAGQEKFCKISETHLSNPVPPSSGSWSGIIKGLLNGASKIPFLAPYANTASAIMTATGILNIVDPRNLLVNYADQIIDHEANMMWYQTRWGSFDDPVLETEYLQMLEAMQSMLTALQSAQSVYKSFDTAYKQCKVRVVHRGRDKIYNYIDQDGEIFDHTKTNRNRDNSKDPSSRFSTISIKKGLAS